MTALPGRTAGFTLVETLVALFIFGLLVTAGAFVLANSAEAVEQVEAASGDVEALQRSRAILAADIGQILMRPSRGENGELRAALESGDIAEGALFAFVRSGPDNPDGEARPALQYVAWFQGSDGVERRAARYLDGAPLGPPALLMAGAQNARAAFRYDGAWSDEPLPAAAAELPQAIRITFDHPRFGRVEQLFSTGIGA